MSDEKIPHYINDPVINAATAPELKLNRPHINYKNASLFVFGHFILAIIIAFCFKILYKPFNFSFALTFFCLVLFLFAISMRFSLIFFVQLYQRYAKSETRLKCCMTPSCSEYSLLALRKYGAIIGTIKTIRRLLRCHPPGEVDYP